MDKWIASCGPWPRAHAKQLVNTALAFTVHGSFTSFWLSNVNQRCEHFVDHGNEP